MQVPKVSDITYAPGIKRSLAIVKEPSSLSTTQKPGLASIVLRYSA